MPWSTECVGSLKVDFANLDNELKWILEESKMCVLREVSEWLLLSYPSRKSFRKAYETSRSTFRS